jgi:hypothetical protein
MASNNFAIISATSPDSSGRLLVLATQEIKFEAETQVTYLDSALEKKVPIGWPFPRFIDGAFCLSCPYRRRNELRGFAVRRRKDEVGVCSSVAGISLLTRLAFGYDRGPEAIPQVIGEFVELGVAVNLNGFLGCIADDVAVMAPRKMIFQFGLGAIVYDSVEIIR